MNSQAPGAPVPQRTVRAQPSELIARAAKLADAGDRRLLGIAGPPGSGKSTLAARLVAELGPERAVLIPMDGFHLADAELRRLGRTDRKGAPDTFDACGYAALLRRLRAPGAGETVYAPGFDRALDQPIAGSLPVPPEVPLVVTEGNYLLLDDGDWRPVRALLDASWYLDIDQELRLTRLTERHERYGKSAADAAHWAQGSDEANALRVAAGRELADLIVELTP